MSTTPTPKTILTGSCACQATTYTTTTPPTTLTNCHCTTCRKQSGAPYQTWAQFPLSSVRFTHGAEALRSRRASNVATRTACARCGSSVSMRYDFNPGMMGIAAGTIDQSAEVPRPARHIYLREKAGWFEVPEDGAERWERHVDGMREAIEGTGKRSNEKGDYVD